MTNSENNNETGSNGKTFTFGEVSWREKLLVSLDEVTLLRGREQIQEIYFLTFGYSGYVKKPSMGGSQAINQPSTLSLPAGRSIMSDLFPSGFKWLADYFFAEVSVPKTMRLGKTDYFSSGLPLFYGKPGIQSSVYFAVIESGRRIGTGPLFEMVDPTLASDLDELRARIEAADGQALDAALHRVVPVLEKSLRGTHDDIRFGDIFTFRQSESYRAGTHRDWGNQRVAFSMSIESPDSVPVSTLATAGQLE